ncbi:fumarate reductase [Rhodobacteraceae bacterium PD-2]|nr:fumarate reductase [Rhodobacteraceae bacterium PD-2]
MLPQPAERPPLDQLGEVDLIVLGSGAAGLTAALTGLLEGFSVAILEVAPYFGGTTARSSGTVWVPDNALMRAAGAGPDRQAAETYLRALIGNIGPEAPWQAFLDAAPAMQSDLETRAGILFRPYMTAADYRSELPGAAPGGRALEPVAFDGRRLGKWFGLLAEPLKDLMVFGGMLVTRAEAARLIRVDRSLSAMALGARLVARYARDRLRHPRGTRLVMGNALVGRMMHGILSRGGLMYESAQTLRLIQDDAGRITGVEGLHDGKSFVLRNRVAVILAGGGFPSDPKKRSEELPAPSPRHSPATPFARGTTMDLALAAGARLGPEGQDNALWLPCSVRVPDGGGGAVWPHIVLDRLKPGCIIVDSKGRRFVNEALSYHDFCRAVISHGPSAQPSWLIADRDFIRRYGLGPIRPRTPRLTSWTASGYLKYGRDIAALASETGLPAETLSDTIARFDANAGRGTDPDFDKGSTLYQRSNGDNTRGLANPCLAPVGQNELFAIALWPMPLGTSRGLVSSVDAEVLDARDRPIPGLFVAGNDMHSCFSGEYPGAGAQIGPGMAFGWRAVRGLSASRR